MKRLLITITAIFLFSGLQAQTPTCQDGCRQSYQALIGYTAYAWGWNDAQCDVEPPELQAAEDIWLTEGQGEMPEALTLSEAQFSVDKLACRENVDRDFTNCTNDMEQTEANCEAGC